MSILIITHSNDNDSVARVIEAVSRKGGHTIRFDTDRYPTDVRLTAYHGTPGDERLTLTNEEGEFDLREVTSIWHRRLNFGAHLPAGLDRQLRHASLGEASAAAHGMLASLKAFRVDHVRHIRHAENKQLQLHAAREVGLNIPRTLTTNDPAAVRLFAKNCEGGMVTKMLSSFAVYDEGRELVVFTNPVKPEDLADLSGLSLCPATFQELIPKLLEVRVTVVGHRVMSAAIDSQVSARAAHDWRRDGLRLLQDWRPYQLPLELEEKILRLMDYFSLNYGAIDIIVTPDGQHVFLELNPSGEFFWLERTPGLPISDAIADLLLGHSPRRSTHPSELWQRGEYTISTDPSRLDIELIHDFISNHSYWGRGRGRDVVQRSIENSMAFGMYHRDQQVGFARIVTDYATFAWVADVFVVPDHRGRGLSKWLMEVVIAHPKLQGFRRWVLATKDAHGLYEQFGFIKLHRPERWMERPDANMKEAPDYWQR